MKKFNILLVLVFLVSTISTKAQDYYFYGYVDSLWTNVGNWDSFNGYPGTTIPAGKYARIPSNWSLGRCSLDVDIINNGHILLQSKFYYNGHTLTNNGLLQFTGTIWGDLTNESTGTLSLGWEPYFPTDNLSVGGSLTNDGLIPFDFRGTDNSWDYFHNITTANLGGEIELRFRDGFEPVLNLEYILMYTNNNGVIGTFDTETLPAGYAGEIIYEHNRVKAIFTGAPLPVELTTFDAIEQDRTTLLTWTTASEKDNAGFEIQKSTDARDWQKIDFIEGNGTTTSSNEYKYVDTNPFSGLNYYRLKQIDLNDEFEYSDVVAVEFSGMKNQVNIYPNPSIGNVTIQVDNPSNQSMEITVYDHLGMIVWESELIEGQTNWKKELDIEKNGTYFITVQMGSVLYFERILVLEKN